MSQSSGDGHQALSGTFVLDLSEGVAGAYCSKLLADLGAGVVKVETPAGDPLRRMGPFAGGKANPEASGLFLHLNANKRGIVLDLESNEGRREVPEPGAPGRPGNP